MHSSQPLTHPVPPDPHFGYSSLSDRHLAYRPQGLISSWLACDHVQVDPTPLANSPAGIAQPHLTSRQSQIMPHVPSDGHTFIADPPVGASSPFTSSRM